MINQVSATDAIDVVGLTFYDTMRGRLQGMRRQAEVREPEKEQKVTLIHRVRKNQQALGCRQDSIKAKVRWFGADDDSRKQQLEKELSERIALAPRWHDFETPELASWTSSGEQSQNGNDEVITQPVPLLITVDPEMAEICVQFLTELGQEEATTRQEVAPDASVKGKRKPSKRKATRKKAARSKKKSDQVNQAQAS